ncbi:hypothetical protein BJ508DRAFT_336119 [Ascobolus immersus RN42]|uniref:Uncharacterized protein n=1 Tax=Ascobolus immersus RN42 TaxID=1160509 RepID=A0A3N4HH09_ASCIM|nr:hypothetical protein BJ508DRAFT_336119 [Ascobolus immersus RN42]
MTEEVPITTQTVSLLQDEEDPLLSSNVDFKDQSEIQWPEEDPDQLKDWDDVATTPEDCLVKVRHIRSPSKSNQRFESQAPNTLNVSLTKMREKCLSEINLETCTTDKFEELERELGQYAQPQQDALYQDMDLKPQDSWSASLSSPRMVWDMFGDSDEDDPAGEDEGKDSNDVYEDEQSQSGYEDGNVSNYKAFASNEYSPTRKMTSPIVPEPWDRLSQNKELEIVPPSIPPINIRVYFVHSVSNFTELASFTLSGFKRFTFRQFIASVGEFGSIHFNFMLYNPILFFAPVRLIKAKKDRACTMIKDAIDLVDMFRYNSIEGVYMKVSAIGEWMPNVNFNWDSLPRLFSIIPEQVDKVRPLETYKFDDYTEKPYTAEELECFEFEEVFRTDLGEDEGDVTDYKAQLKWEMNAIDLQGYTVMHLMEAEQSLLRCSGVISGWYSKRNESVSFEHPRPPVQKDTCEGTSTREVQVKIEEIEELKKRAGPAHINDPMPLQKQFEKSGKDVNNPFVIESTPTTDAHKFRGSKSNIRLSPPLNLFSQQVIQQAYKPPDTKKARTPSKRTRDASLGLPMDEEQPPKSRSKLMGPDALALAARINSMIHRIHQVTNDKIAAAHPDEQDKGSGKRFPAKTVETKAQPKRNSTREVSLVNLDLLPVTRVLRSHTKADNETETIAPTNPPVVSKEITTTKKHVVTSKIRSLQKGDISSSTLPLKASILSTIYVNLDVSSRHKEGNNLAASTSRQTEPNRKFAPLAEDRNILSLSSVRSKQSGPVVQVPSTPPPQQKSLPKMQLAVILPSCQYQVFCTLLQGMPAIAGWSALSPRLALFMAP